MVQTQGPCYVAQAALKGNVLLQPQGDAIRSMCPYASADSLDETCHLVLLNL